MPFCIACDALTSNPHGFCSTACHDKYVGDLIAIATEDPTVPFDSCGMCGKEIYNDENCGCSENES